MARGQEFWRSESMQETFTMNYAALLSRPEYKFYHAAIQFGLQERKVLITGAGGSIGSAVTQYVCCSSPRSVTVVGHSELPIFNLMKSLPPSLSAKVTPYVLDVGSAEMRRLVCLTQPDIIIHAAAHKHVGLMEAQPEEAFRNNTLGTISLAEAAILNGVERFIFISTDKAACPQSNMGASKRLAEAWLLANYPESTIVRFGNVLGSSGSLVEIAIKKIEAGEAVTLTDSRMKRFFITIDEAVGLVLTSGLLFGRGTYILDMGEPVLVESLLYRLAAELGEPLSSCIVTEAGVGEKLSEDLLNPGEVKSATRHEKIFQIHSTRPMTPDDVDAALAKCPRNLKAVAQQL